MTSSIGMAIKITESNLDKIAVVNENVKPALEDKPTYFVFLYNETFPCWIFTEEDFNSKYRFAAPPNDDYFVAIVQNL